MQIHDKKYKNAYSIVDAAWKKNLGMDRTGAEAVCRLSKPKNVKIKMSNMFIMYICIIKRYNSA